MPSGGRNRNTPERFWGNVEIGKPSECWPWKLCVSTTRGYGFVAFQGSVRLAHRVAYELHHGVTLPRYGRGTDKSAVLVMHTCDNRICCNPAHLVLGTHKQNRDDCVAKGRGNFVTGDRNHVRKNPEIVRGSNNGHAKLTADQVREIRRRLGEGERGSDIAKAYGVAIQTISAVKHRYTWRHI